MADTGELTSSSGSFTVTDTKVWSLMHLVLPYTLHVSPCKMRSASFRRGSALHPLYSEKTRSLHVKTDGHLGQ